MGHHRTVPTRNRSLKIAGVAVATVAAVGLGLTATGTVLPVGDNASFAEKLPFVVTKDEAGRQYMNLVTPYNASTARTVRLLQVEPVDFARVRDAADEAADDNRSLSIGLQEAKWPRNAQSTIDALVLLTAKDQFAWRSLARAEDAGDVRDAFVELTKTKDEGDALAELLRQKFRLPERTDSAPFSPTTTPPSPSPSPSSVSLPSAEPPAPPSPAARNGFSAGFVFDGDGCAEVPKSVFTAVNRNLSSNFKAVLGAASQWEGDSAVLTFYVERQDYFAEYLELDLYINTRGALYSYGVGDELVPRLPQAPAELYESNGTPNGLAFCSKSILGDVINE
jgi:hypothetical protein